MKRWLSVVVAGLATGAFAQPLTHTFLASGGITAIMDETGKQTWTGPGNTRFATFQPDGTILVVMGPGGSFPHGGVQLLSQENKVLFEWRGSDKEVNCAEVLPNGNILVNQASTNNPRLLELDRKGQIKLEIPLACQKTNAHQGVRAVKQLEPGRYFVSQMIDRVLREYDASGKTLSEIQTVSAAGPAVRLPNGDTLLTLPLANSVQELDARGHVVWQLGNKDFPKPIIGNPCGIQRLPNGNTVVANANPKEQGIKAFEVTPAKEIVWTCVNTNKAMLLTIQVLTTNGKPLADAELRNPR